MIKRLITVTRNVTRTATLAVCTIFTLAACQSAPDPVVLNPQVDTTASGASLALNVRDQRAHNHVLRLEHSDQTADFATADPSLASLISDRVAKRWALDDASDTQLQVTIEEAVFVVKQGSLRHDTEHRVRLQATLTTANGEVEKTFSGSRESNGPLRADVKKIEGEFAALLASVLNDLVNDDTLNQHIVGEAE